MSTFGFLQISQDILFETGFSSAFEITEEYFKAFPLNKRRGDHWQDEHKKIIAIYLSIDETTTAEHSAGRGSLTLTQISAGRLANFSVRPTDVRFCQQ